MLIKQRKSLANISQKNTLSALLYTNTIQQNYELENSYQNQIHKYHLEKKLEEENLHKIQRQIETVSREISELEKAKTNSQAIHIFQPKLFKIQKQIETVSREISELEKAKTNSQAIHIFQPELFKIQKQIEAVSKEIDDLEKEKNNIQNIKITQPPTAKSLPLPESKTKRNTILASFVGLFLMVFLAFFLEYINKYKNRLRDSSLKQ